MDVREAKAKSKHTQMVAPRRGRVKIGIFKSIAALLLSCSGCDKTPRKGDDNAAIPVPVPLSSTSSTPPLPSGYSSDA